MIGVVGHRVTPDTKIVDADAMDRLRIGVRIRAHDERAARHVAESLEIARVTPEREKPRCAISIGGGEAAGLDQIEQLGGNDFVLFGPRQQQRGEERGIVSARQQTLGELRPQRRVASEEAAEAVSPEIGGREELSGNLGEGHRLQVAGRDQTIPRPVGRGAGRKGGVGGAGGLRRLAGQPDVDQVFGRFGRLGNRQRQGKERRIGRHFGERRRRDNGMCVKISGTLLHTQWTQTVNRNSGGQEPAPHHGAVTKQQQGAPLLSGQGLAQKRFTLRAEAIDAVQDEESFTRGKRVKIVRAADRDQIGSDLIGKLSGEHGLAAAARPEQQQPRKHLDRLTCGEKHRLLRRRAGVAQRTETLCRLVLVAEIHPECEVGRTHANSLATSGLWKRWISRA